MRTNIPSFRLPEKSSTDEIANILNIGVTIRYNSPVESLASLLEPSAKGEGSVLRDKPYFDSVFIGSGAPRGKDLEICPAATLTANLHGSHPY